MFRNKVVSPVKIILSQDEQKRVADFFLLLIAIDRNVKKEKVTKKKGSKTRYPQREIGLP